MAKRYNNKRVMIFSDLHFPYTHPDALPFLSAVKEEIQPDRVLNLGDEIDSHALSFYPTMPDLDNATRELKLGRKRIKQLAEMFPDLICVSSNHTDRIYRAATSAGIPKELILPYDEMLGVQDYNWTWDKDKLITLPNRSHVLFSHYKGSNVLLASQRCGMSVVQGHIHSKQSINYWHNGYSNNFAMQCASLVDDTSSAFAYNVSQPIRPQLGVCAIIDSKPVLIPMGTKKSGRWNKKVVI